MSDEVKQDPQKFDRRSADQPLQQLLAGQGEIKSMLRDLTRAFPKNEYDEPDYEGHRRAHQEMMKAADKATEDKRSAVNKVRDALLIGIGSIFLAALWDYIKVHLK